MKDFSYVTAPSPAYLEELYQEYLKAPETSNPDWKNFFEGFDFAISTQNGHSQSEAKLDLSKEFAVYALIRGYRKRGHLLATTNPIRPRKDRHPHLEHTDYGLGEEHLEQSFQSGKYLGMRGAKLKDIIAELKRIYAEDAGIEYTYITDEHRCKWVEREFENMMRNELSIERKKSILSKLNEGVIFEKFLHTKYIGQKRFSLEGGESAIPALHTIINEAAESDVQEVVIGMAHRGRLNILANILKKTYEQIFNEFEGNTPDDTTMGSGDVKYHLGFRSIITTDTNKEINVQLTPNPSHLEVVGPVVSGFARAKADAIYKENYSKVLPIIIHGDAALAGLGVVYELLQMSLLRGYHTGGTIHFVINNQIGFTTDFQDARSSDYSTSVAAMIQAPVLHVNGDNPEAVVKAAMLAVKYRQEFSQDIFIDMVCYRRHGHNEGDDPSLTQPKMYDIIKKHPNARERYNEILIARGDIDAQLAKEMEKRYWSDLQERLDEIKQNAVPYHLQAPEKAWAKLRHAVAKDFEASPDTGISKKQFDALYDVVMNYPEDFTPSAKLIKLLNEKKRLAKEEGLLDWATAELMAYASLVSDGKRVRMSGQDVERGTFSHRHAILHDIKNYNKHNRLSPLNNDEGKFYIYNSLLNELAVAGFEYGYSIANPNTLTIWEAQFGDFGNGAQTIIDQYISSAEVKWRKMSGLVFLLPHGFEGQGPEHSSARMERFLNLCAENNMFITNVTTAANLFHLLRRQLAYPFRKPLINFSPKANLRLPKSYSAETEFIEGKFHEVINDATVKKVESIKRVIFCSGKVYFDLVEQRAKLKLSNVAIIRLEQIYPTPVKQLVELKKQYKQAEWMWVQEEPRNSGAAAFLHFNLTDIQFSIVSRPAAAAPATGYGKVHARELAQLMSAAFEGLS